MKRMPAEPLTHCGRMTKTEPTCNLIDSVLGGMDWHPNETENGGALVGKVDGDIPCQKSIHHHPGGQLAGRDFRLSDLSLFHFLHRSQPLDTVLWTDAPSPHYS